MSEILDLCLKAIKIAEKEGAEQAECYFSHNDSIEIKIKKNEIKSAKKLSDFGIGIRCVLNKSIGFSYTTNIEKVEETVKRAVKQAKLGYKDPYFKSFAEKQKYSNVYGIFDDEIKNLDVDEACKIVIPSLKIDMDKRIKSLNVSFSSSNLKVAIANSLGIEAFDKGTLLSFDVEISAEENGKYSSSIDYYVSRKLKDFEPEKIVKNVCEYAIKGLNKQKIHSMKGEVLLDPISVFFVIGVSFTMGLNADSIQRKRSFLTEDLNNKIANEKLTIIDDATLEGGIGSFKFDAEGVSSQRNILVENGYLKTFIYDTYTANKENKKSTGNATRGNFRSLPMISIRNMIIKEGNKSYEDLISEIKRGIYLRSTFDYPNAITGEFSGMINEGFYVENGEIKYAVLQTGIGGKLKEFFSNIVGISKETRWFANYKLPYILIENVNIAGAI